MTNTNRQQNQGQNQSQNQDIASLERYENETEADFQARIDAQQDQQSGSSGIQRE